MSRQVDVATPPAADPSRPRPLPVDRWGDRPSQRLEAFSDAVFGFSATLLVVSLEVPNTFRELTASLWGFLPFALSFLAFVLIWSVHHAFFRRYGLADRPTIVINSILLFVVLFYVYPLKFMSVSMLTEWIRITPGPRSQRSVMFTEVGEVGQLFVIYGLGFFAVFACVALLYRHAYRCAASLGLDPAGEHEAGMLGRHYLILASAGLLSAGLATAGVGVRWGLPGIAYSLIGPAAWIHGTWSARRAPAAGLALPSP